MTDLVIVESPTKARTIQKVLGSDYRVLACFGHVRDLLPKEGAVDPEHGFALHYVAKEESERHMQAIAKAMRGAKTLFLATDPDREGEAIAWHLLELLKEHGDLSDQEAQRIVFHEITERAIREAMTHPRAISENLVNAQQARRALDYLVGFNLSPLLWRKVRRGLSAGRVQSPALRLITEREAEIAAFVARPYWTIWAHSRKDGQDFRARLVRYRDAKVEQFTFAEQQLVDVACEAIADDAQGSLVVSQVTEKSRRRQPPPPFITSTLQQEAARQLGFTTRRTMQVAQQLYEGIAVGGGEPVGLITYMRTDSVRLASEAVSDIRQYIRKRFGAGNLPEKARVFRSKSKNAQEAHEAIRPSAVEREPQAIAAHLSGDQARLYELIWKRAVACQMREALYDTVSAELDAGPAHGFRATGSVLREPGYLALYQEARDEDAADDESMKALPPLAVGDRLPLLAVQDERHTTEPPPRYTEASLVKALEERGIGRPSTYASIISTLKDRDYVTLNDKRFVPTDTGVVVAGFLGRHFERYVDYAFTARMEDQLDAIARGEALWVQVLERFWKNFKQQVDDINEHVSRKDATTEALEESCPQCGKPLLVRLGKRGRFIGCSGYPECGYTRNMDGSEQAEQDNKPIEGRVCPQCKAPLLQRTGRYGPFIGCSAYPKCRYVEKVVDKKEDSGIPCPSCHKGTLVRKRGRQGRSFFSCSAYPDCKYALSYPPVAEPCPQCGGPILMLRTTKRHGTEMVCPNKECGYARAVQGPAPEADPNQQPSVASSP